ncbi:universal stress protein Sll1388-like [Mytilus edulis]|uniref:universal stress protein Sll1388-like n=1 Tax=Mytilus edulis TaxID=6550 RepID=UPI0039F1221A
MADGNAASASEAGCRKDGGKTVVIAFDGSDYAKHAMKFYADTVYTPTDNVIVVYCVELGEVITTAHFSVDQEAFKELIQHESDKIKNRLVEFAVYMRNIKLNGIVKSTHASTPGLGVVNLANEFNADLIVTGSRGHGTLRRTFLGSVSDYILHHSKVPVLVVTLQKEVEDKHRT